MAEPAAPIRKPRGGPGSAIWRRNCRRRATDCFPHGPVCAMDSRARED